MTNKQDDRNEGYDMSERDEMKRRDAGQTDISSEKHSGNEETEKNAQKTVAEKWGSIGGLLVGMLTPVMAIDKMPRIAWSCIGFLVVCIIVQLLEWTIGFDRLTGRTQEVAGGVKRVFHCVLSFLAGFKSILAVSAGVFIIFGIIYVFYPASRYYGEITEVYGMPEGVGEELSGSERKELAGYWKITDHVISRRMTLEYIEPYGQLDLMQKYSSLYQMAFFQPTAKIEYHYRKSGKDRSPEEISYYNSSGKILLQMEVKGEGKYEVVSCAEEDKPQLLQSTLFRVPEDRSAEKLMAAQIEVVYDDDGRPGVRRLGSGVYNQYGINGERYEYDSGGRIAKLCYLDINGEPICNKLGIMMVAFKYNDEGKLQSIQYFSDEEEKDKTEGFWGVACEKFAYDQNGNLKERRQENRGGEWWYDTKDVYMYQYSYEKGRLVREEYLGQGKVPARENDLYSSSRNFKEGKISGNRSITIILDSMDSNDDAGSMAAPSCTV